MARILDEEYGVVYAECAGCVENFRRLLCGVYCSPMQRKFAAPRGTPPAVDNDAYFACFRRRARAGDVRGLPPRGAVITGDVVWASASLLRWRLAQTAQGTEPSFESEMLVGRRAAWTASARGHRPALLEVPCSWVAAWDTPDAVAAAYEAAADIRDGAISEALADAPTRARWQQSC